MPVPPAGSPAGSVHPPNAVSISSRLAPGGGHREPADEPGWSPDDFERWVADTLQRNLLAATAAPG